MLKSLSVFFGYALLLAALASAPAFGSDPAFEVKGAGVVTWVADGDTMRVRIDDASAYRALRSRAEVEQQQTSRNLRVRDRFHDSSNSMLVRVGNIDTPESVHPDASRNTDEGRAASAYVKDLLSDKRVEFVCWDIGYWGRPICSLYNGDLGHGVDLGVHLVEKGHAEYVNGFGAHPYWDEQYRAAAGMRR